VLAVVIEAPAVHDEGEVNGDHLSCQERLSSASSPSARLLRDRGIVANLVANFSEHTFYELRPLTRPRLRSWPTCRTGVIWNRTVLVIPGVKRALELLYSGSQLSQEAETIVEVLRLHDLTST
jgi:hypothetical protein